MTSKLYSAMLNISYKNGTKCCIYCLEVREAYNAACRMIRKWDFIESVELETKTVRLKMRVREYAGGMMIQKIIKGE